MDEMNLFEMNLFWVVIPVAAGLFLVGLYLNLLKKLTIVCLTLSDLMRLPRLSPGSFFPYALMEALLLSSLFHRSKFRWFRHMCLYWGFVLLLLADLFGIVVSKYFIVDYFATGNGKGLLKVLFDSLGLVLLMGLVLALARWRRFRNTEESIYSDPGMCYLLLVVVAGGFLVEGLHAASRPSHLTQDYAFAGQALAQLFRSSPVPLDAIYSPVWVFHAVSAAAFIAYVTFGRFIHVLAVPLGWLGDSQQHVWREKVELVAGGLLGAASPAQIWTAGVGQSRTWTVDDDELLNRKLRVNLVVRFLTFALAIISGGYLFFASTYYVTIGSAGSLAIGASAATMVIGLGIFLFVVDKNDVSGRAAQGTRNKVQHDQSVPMPQHLEV